MQDAKLQPENLQGLDIRSTPREEMELFPLDTFRYEYPGKEIWVEFEMPEFTAICPFSDFPDFAVIKLKYVPNERCIELKSLKLYIWSYRNEATFHEAVTNHIVDDLVAVLEPRYLRLTAKFYVRGGIFTNVVVEHRKSGWQPLPPVDLAKFGSQRPTRE